MAALLVIGLLTGTTPAVRAQVAPDIPLGHPAYDYLERLADVGLAPDYMRGMRPISLTYALALVRRAEELAKTRGRPEPSFLPALRDHLERLRAHDLGRGHVGGEAGVAVTARDEVLTPVPNAHAEVAGQFPLPRGVGLAAGSGMAVGVGARLDYGRFFAADVGVQAGFPARGAEVELRRGYAKVGYGALELLAGRGDLVWGQSRYASLLLSGNARAFDQVALRTSRPVRLPWVLKWLGQWQAALFWARQDALVPARGPSLIGERLGVLVLPWLEIGGGHIFNFGGDGAPHVSFTRFVWEFFGHRPDLYTANYANHAFAWDLRVRVKDWFEVYGEHYLEDCCTQIWRTETTLLGGVRRARVFTSRDDLSVEVVHTSRIAFTGTVETDDWVHDGRITGHPLGTLGLATYALWRLLLDSGGVVKVRAGFERRGPPERTADPDEWRIGGVAEWRFPLRRGRAGRVEARGRLGLERVLSAGHVRGADRTAGLLELAIEAAF